MLERFLQELAEGIIFASPARFHEESALALAREVWQELKANSEDAYPCMTAVQHDEIRFVYQWDEHPPLITVMIWDEIMWRDMARIVVPDELAE